MLPAAVGRTAGAVGGLADSSLMVRMARSRAWIAVLATLLGGIVALNVFGLSVSSSVSATAAEADRVERENSLLRERITKANARRGARTAERAALAAAAVPAVSAVEAVPALPAPEPEVAPVEEAGVETEPAGVPVEPVDPVESTPTQARTDEGSDAGAGPAGGVGSP